jgi:ribosomal protein L11 methyltransferase
MMDDFEPFAIEEMGQAVETDTGSRQPARRIHFSSRSDRAAAADAIAQSFHGQGVVATPVEVVDDGDAWARRCQADLRAVRVAQIVIAPPWDIRPTTDEIATVVIEPSIGFGTGHHPSTRLCVRALQQQPVRGCAAIDFGTGSGVLAIAAAKLGAASVLAVDDDPDAISAARRNLTGNGVESVVTLRCEDLRTLAPPAPVPLLLANLSGALLCNLADTILKSVTPGGSLIASGLTVDENARVLATFGPSATLRDRLCEDGWSCLILQPET